MDASDTVVQHIAKVQNMARQLLDLGQNLPDIQVMSKIIVSLPTKYRNFRTAWNSVKPTRQTIEYLKQPLMEEECYMNEEEREIEALAAISTAPRGSSYPSRPHRGNNQRRDRKDLHCFVCDKRGHFARECHHRKHQSDEQEGESMHEHSALIATVRQSTPSNSNEKSVEPSAEQKRKLLSTDQADGWLLDSGASVHLTSRADWFAEYYPRRDGSTMVLEDNRECAIVGEGVIEIEKLVNGQWLPSRIEKVLHVPELKKNLLSLGVCTVRGLEVSFSGETGRITQANKTIAHVLKRPNETYWLFIRDKRAG